MLEKIVQKNVHNFFSTTPLWPAEASGSRHPHVLIYISKEK
jgi:hypothetical protein